MTDYIDSINNQEELEKASPDTVKFHGTFKSLPKMLIKYADLIPLDEEGYARQLKGNARIIYEIIKEWEHFEKRNHVRKTMAKPLKIEDFTYFFDSDYRERGDFILHRIIQRMNEFVFPPHHLDPGCWTDNEDNRAVSGAVVPSDVVVLKNRDVIVLKVQLPPRKYWIAVEGIDRYYGIDSNRPIFMGTGWAYPLILDYGTREQFDHNLLFGDPV